MMTYVMETSDSTREDTLIKDLREGTEKRQREVVRTLGANLKTCLEWNSDTKTTSDILIEHYLTLPSKSSLKPYVLSYVDSCDGRIADEIERAFVDHLGEKLRTADSRRRRVLSDSICRLLDCKSLGPRIIANLIHPVLKFLSWSVKSAHEESSRTEDSIEFNDAMTDIKVSVHTLNKFLQKTDLEHEDKRVVEDVIGICVSVIKQENALLDCQTSCAMTLPLVYRILHGQNAVQLLVRDLFEKPRSEFKVSTNSLQMYLCFLTGLVGGLTADDLMSVYNGGTILSFATEKVFEAYDLIQEGTKAKYALSRCLVVLTSKILICTGVDLPNFHLMQKRLLEYVYNHLEDPVDAIRHQAKNVFENVTKVHVDHRQGNDELVDLVKDLISMDWHKKGKYGLLAVLSVHLETEVFLAICPNLPNLMLSSLDEVGMSNYVCDLYDKLMVKHRNHVSEDEWHRIWLDPVVEAMSNPELRHGVIVFVLPRVLQATKSGMKYIIPTLINGEMHNDSLLVLVTCLKRARCLGYVPQTSGDDALWNDVLPNKLLSRALEHADAGLRVEAFGLLCFNPKSTELIPKYDLDLLLEFLTNNLTSQSPATRQDIVSAFRKLLMRIKESWMLMVKKKVQEEAMHYVKFTRDLYEGLLQNIYAGVSYTRRTSALSLLIATVAQLKDVAQLPTLDSVASEAHAENLFQILTDTFEENKTNSLALLLDVDGGKLGLNSVDRIAEIMNICDELVVTTRPQDCTTAAFLHKLLVQQPTLIEAFSSDLENRVKNRQFLLLKKMLSELKRHVELGEKDLIHASVHAPMYPVLHCIRYLLSDVEYAKLAPELWREVLNALVELSFNACAVVSPVISHASPEGNVPVSDLIGGEGDDVSLSTVQDMPEFLVVCSWRTVKEVALLLGDLSNWPVYAQQDDSGFITVDILLKIGQFYTDLLLESRHRGAFELAYAGFQPMCAMLWSSKLESMNRLPQQWLKQILSDVESSDEETSRLCATRRSAGVPFYVLAIVVTEPKSRGRKCLSSAMDSLLTLAESDRVMCQIHALNCVRALYKDTRLGESVLGHVSQGIQISILGFSAESWAVRNASTLLFSTLMVRIFGVRRDRNVLSCKNSLSGRVFFYRYPALFPFLLRRLGECTDNIETLNPGLYPVLMVLGRLTPSILEGTDTAMNVAEFIPSVMRCAASPVLKTRQMGAKALCPIVFKDQLEPILNQICESLEASWSQNLTHGLLLQLIFLLEDAVLRKLVVSDQVLRRIYKSNWLMSRRNPCYMTRGAYIQVVRSIMELVRDARLLERLHGDVLVIVHQESAGLTPSKNLCHSHFMSDLIGLYAAKCRDFDDGRLLAFLSGHRLYEVREITLKCLRRNRDLIPENLTKRLEKEEHPSCLALLLEILALEFNESTSGKVRELSSRRHEVRCARLRYLAGSGNDEDRLSLVRDLLESCKPEQVFGTRLASADALYKLRHLLIERNPLQTQVWSICLTLLLDDDEDVRTRAAEVVGQLEGPNTESASWSHSVALNRAVDSVFRSLTVSDCIAFVVDLLRGPEKPENIVERLFDKGEQSTYEDRIHLIILVTKKFEEHCRVAKFSFCEKLVVNLYKASANDFNQHLISTSTSLHQRFVVTSTYTEQLCDNFGLFTALYVLDKIRCKLRMAEFEPSFTDVKCKYFGLYPTLIWPLTLFN